MNKIFTEIQNTLSAIYKIVLNNIYLKALLLIIIILWAITLFTLIIILSFKMPIIGIAAISIIIYFEILNE